MISNAAHAPAAVRTGFVPVPRRGPVSYTHLVTENKQAATQFTRSVDAACVYVNVSTAFTDGRQFGFGAEVGISTQKLHARGPMGLPELTTYKLSLIHI